MKKLLILGGVLCLILAGLTGCVEESDEHITYVIPEPDMFPSNSGDVILIVIDDSDLISDVANTIERMYDDGYVYVDNLIVNPSINAHNQMENYMIFIRQGHPM